MQYSSHFHKIKPSASMQAGLLEDAHLYSNLAIGVSDLPPPTQLQSLIEDFAKQNYLPYVASKGSKKARTNLSNIIFRNEDVDPDEVVLVNGAKWGLHLALMGILNPGDHVILMEPYWLSYPEMISLQYAHFISWKPTVSVSGELSFHLDSLLALLETHKPKVLILNNPNNPSGMLFSKEFVDKVAQILHQNGAWLIIDEVYKDLLFSRADEKEFYSKGENIIRIGSFSKSIASPGLRLGYIQAKQEFISFLDKMNQHMQTCVTGLSHFVMENLDKQVYLDYVSYSSAIFHNRYLVLESSLKGSKFKHLKGSASFYALVNFSSFAASGEDACKKLLSEYKILATPGGAYGQSFSEYVRVCLTVDEKKLKEIFEVLIAKS
jgi:aspartate/methionine/tyrosine aminotransferase